MFSRSCRNWISGETRRQGSLNCIFARRKSSSGYTGPVTCSSTIRSSCFTHGPKRYPRLEGFGSISFVGGDTARVLVAPGSEEHRLSQSTVGETRWCSDSQGGGGWGRGLGASAGTGVVPQARGCEHPRHCLRPSFLADAEFSPDLLLQVPRMIARGSSGTCCQNTTRSSLAVTYLGGSCLGTGRS